MRARDMMVKLDRLPTQDDEKVKVWDLSLLSPEQQDRATALMKLIDSAEDIEAENLEPVFTEFGALVQDLPLLGKDEPERGPLIAAPKDLAHYWQWQQKASGWQHYSFHRLGKVQTLRFVELCRRLRFKADSDQRSDGSIG